MYKCPKIFVTIELLANIGQQLFKDFSGCKNWEVFPDVVPTLERIKSTGIIIGAVSNFDDRLRMTHYDIGCVYSIEIIFYRWYFEEFENSTVF